MDKAINNWIKSSDYDIETAKAMFETKRFVYVIFMCHLAIEKALKAFVSLKTKKIPPKTHDLFILVKLAALDIPDEHKLIVMHLNETSVPTRYPADIAVLIKVYNGKIAKKYLQETEDFLKWLKTELK